MMKPIWLFVVYGCLAVMGTVSAQNLVPNHSFETCSTCPDEAGQISNATPWQNGNGGSTDYLNACAGAFVVGVPGNDYGSAGAYHGLAYARIIVYNPTNASGWREYAQVQLSAPLVAGQNYFVGYHYLNCTGRYAVDDLGMYFSATPPVETGAWYFGRIHPGTNACSIVPQLRTPEGVPLTEQVMWQEFSGTYAATGGEQWLTIGAFNTDADFTIVNRGMGMGQQTASYYLDGFFVIRISGLDIDLETFESRCEGGREWIYWELGPQDDAEKCILEYSSDALTFTPVYVSEPAADHYAYESKQPGYYRLTLFDNDGEVVQSDIISSGNCAETSPSLIAFWHYTNDQLTIGFDAGNVSFEVMDLSGKAVIPLQQLDHQQQNYTTTIRLAPGAYVVRAVDGTGVKSETKLIFVE
jgi:hypothetical protein